MIKRIVKLTFKEDKIDEFLEIFNSSKEEIRKFEGCIGLELLRDADFGNKYYTCSYWNSENDLKNYRNSELFGSTWKKTKALFSEKAEAHSLVSIDKL